LGLAVRLLTATFKPLAFRRALAGAGSRIASACLLAILAAGCLKTDGQTAQIDASSVGSVMPGPPSAPGDVAVPHDAPATVPASRAATASPGARNPLLIPPDLRPGAVPSINASQVTGALPAAATAQAQSATRRQTARPAQPTKLADAVASAVLIHPEIKLSDARAREAKAGVNIARAALYPSADLRVATGINFAGSYEGLSIPYKTSANAADGRADGGVILRQLVYDFGAARNDIERAELLRDAERLKVRDKIDEIAYKTTQTYLRVLEQRALVSLVDEIIVAHEQLARVVQAHAKEGHGTIADVQRVNSRLVDVRAIRSDVTLQLRSAEDQFERLTRQRPSRLVSPPDVRRSLPGSPANAVAQMLANNPRLAALQSTTQSSRKELDSQRAGLLPKINMEIESESKNFRNGPSGRTQAEARAMISMRYRLMDGGLGEATQQQILARIEGGEFSYLNEREQLEADIRQAYRAIDSSGRKLKLVSEGVNASSKVRQLYLEQFKGGKRTVFELLDSQMSYFTIRRNQIENQFEGQRATFDILRATGSLTAVLARPM
jgi:outer membrane protein, adhesin transport system